MARSEPLSDIAAGRRAATRTRPLLRVRLPKLAVKGKPATPEVAALTNALIGILDSAKLPTAKCELVVTLERGRADDLVTDDLPAEDRSGLEAAVRSVLREGAGGEASLAFGGVRLRLNLVADSATAERRREQQAVGVVPGRIVEAFNRAVGSEFKDLPTEYGARRAALAALSDSVRLAIARALEPAFNEQAASMPQSTYEEKKDLAKWVNAELRRFGLALKSDRTERPCILVGNPGNRPDTGRFMLQYADERGKLHNPQTSVTLPHLELMPDDLVRASYMPSRGRGR